MLLDERTALHNIIHQLLPRAAKSLTERSPSRRITSKLQQDDYDQIRSQLLKIKLNPNATTSSTTVIRPTKQQNSPTTATPNTSPKKSRRRIFEDDGSFQPQHRYSKRILKQNRISTATSKLIPEPVRAFLVNHVNRLVEPMHDTMALKIQRDSLNAKSNITKALGRYAINKEYYHRMYHQNGKELNPQIREFLDKKKAILQQNARTIRTSDFYENRRLFKKLPQKKEQKESSATPASEYREFCQRIIEYSKDQPRRNSDADAENANNNNVDVYRTKPSFVANLDGSGLHESLHQQLSDSPQRNTPSRSKSNVDVRRTKLPFNVDLRQFELEARALQRLMHEKKTTMTRVDIHKRNLNRDEKKLRTMVNLADYIGYS